MLGGTIVKKLLLKNYKVIAAYRKNLPKISKHKNLKILRFNLKNKIKINEDYDILIHCASAIPSYNVSAKEMVDVNYFGFVKLLDNALKNNCKKVILISTMSVYGKISKKIINEYYQGKNLDAYGKSKKMMEKYLNVFSKKNRVTFIIFRLSGIVGEKSISYLSRVLDKIKSGEEIVFSNPNLKFNTFIHVDNFANIAYKFIKKQKRNCIYNIGTRYPLKLKKIILYIFKRSKIKPNYKIISSSNKGYTIKLSKNLKKKCKIFSTKKTLDLFLKQNLN